MDVVLPSGTLAVLCPLPGKPVVSPWEVKGRLLSFFFFFFLINLFILFIFSFGCIGSSLLHAGFL